MKQIKIMPEQLANQIAAGEVVERPASVLKECIENSFDAGAESVEVRLERAGAQYISVKDNGSGIVSDDLELALCRHATSKISVIEDLHSLHTMGFRGEALASIASVSHITLASRLHDQEIGWAVTAHGGLVAERAPVNMAPGTRIEIEDLFFNTPARRRFMRSERTELGHIDDMFKRLALSRPSVAMELMHHDKVLRHYPKGEDFLDQHDRLKSIFSEEWMRHAVPIYAETEGFTLRAWCTRPSYVRAQADWQYLFVNGRSVRDLGFSHAVKRALADLLYQDKHASWLCYLEVNPEWVDVNIHPTKDRVRFSEAPLLMDWVYKTMRSAFRDKAQPSNAVTDFLKAAAPLHRQSSAHVSVADFQRIQTPSSPSERTLPRQDRGYAAPQYSVTRPVPQDLFSSVVSHNMRALCQINGVYLLAMDGNDICVIDVHAAHERLLLESLRTQIKERGWQLERLLVPLVLEEGWDSALLEQYRDVLSSYACVVECIGGLWHLSAHPKGLSAADACDFLRRLLEQFGHDLLEADRDEVVMEMLAGVACRMAVKASRVMTPTECDQFLSQLSGIPEVCNHGRPWRWVISYEELEQYFMRGR